MTIELIDAPTKEQLDFFEKRIEEFNLERWDIKHKQPIAVEVRSAEGQVLGGAAGRTFGLWLLLDNLWISEKLRGQGTGSKILQSIEQGARSRGCRFVLLETLDFQARPFYEKHGYKVEWTQMHYPQVGRKYFMTKDLGQIPP